MKKERLPEFYFLCFFAYSVLGWCYEVFLEVVVYRWGFSNRGFLFGPYCPAFNWTAWLAPPQKADTWQSEYESDPRIFIDNGPDNTAGTGDKLPAGSSNRQLALGLLDIPGEFPGAHCPEPEFPVWRGRNDILIYLAAAV